MGLEPSILFAREGSGFLGVVFCAISCEVLRDDVAGEAATAAPANTVEQARCELQGLPSICFRWFLFGGGGHHRDHDF